MNKMKFIVLLLLILVVFSSLVLVSCSSNNVANGDGVIEDVNSQNDDYSSMSDEEVFDSSLESDFVLDTDYVEIGSMI